MPLIAPQVLTPIGFMLAPSDRPSRAVAAALTLAQDAGWLQQVAANSGSLQAIQSGA